MGKNLQLIVKDRGHDTPKVVGPGAYKPQYEHIFKRI